MGEVISLDARRAQVAARHGRSPRRTATFYADLLAPETYLAAERVDRLFGAVAWVPVPALAGPVAVDEARRATVTARARALRMPLVWPETDACSPRTLRIATLAADCGALGAFALAIGRLSFCGGFDVDDPEILAEAAAAAGLDIDACLAAAVDDTRDVAPRQTASALLARGVERLPVLEIGGRLYSGEERLPEALAAARAPAAPPRRTG